MKILVLGGTGAMGVPLVEMLSEENSVFVTSRTQRVSACQSVCYLRGDAHEDRFFTELLEEHAPFDAIVDFMIYNTEEFQACVPLLPASTRQMVPDPVFVGKGEVPKAPLEI